MSFEEDVSWKLAAIKKQSPAAVINEHFNLVVEANNTGARFNSVGDESDDPIVSN